MNRVLPALLSALLALSSCVSSIQEEETPQIVDKGLQEGVLTLRLSEELAASICGPEVKSLSGNPDLDCALDAIGAVSIARLFPEDSVYERRQRAAGLHRFFRVVYDPEAAEKTKAASDLSAVPGVLSASAPRKIEPSGVPLPFNDPDALSHQWHYANDGTLSSSHVRGADINVVPVWERFTGGKPEVVVAVVDGGADVQNPDLGANIIPFGADGSWNFCVDDGALSPYGHGTHVAGTICATNNNGRLVCGVAGGTDGSGGVKVLNCQVFMYDPEFTGKENWWNHIVQAAPAPAIVYACNHGALICNNSWGYDFSSRAQALNASISEEDAAAIDYFVRYAGCDESGNQKPDSPMKGGLVVFAAGNDGWSDVPPSDYEKVVSVGAVIPFLERAAYSNYGSTVDICAPGGVAYSDDLPESAVWSTFPIDEAYVSPSYQVLSGPLNGTSMAAPHVSGIAALIVSWFGGQGFTCEDLRERLLGGADRVAVKDFDHPIGPLADAYGSFLYGASLCKEVTDLTANGHGLSADVTCTVPDGAYGCLFVAADNPEILESPDPADLPESVRSVSYWGTGEASAKLVLDNEQTYYVTAIPRSRNIFGPACAPVSFSTARNNPPSAPEKAQFVLDSLWRTDTLDLYTIFTDPDDDPLDFTAESSDTSVVRASVSEGLLLMTSHNYGRTTVALTGTDAGGLSASSVLEVASRDGSTPFSLYPMPVTDALNISSSRPLAVKYALYSPAGKLIAEGSGRCSCFEPLVLDISSCAPGIYMLECTTEDGKWRYQVVKI